MIRLNLTLEDKIRLIHFRELHKNASLVARICKVKRMIVSRCWKQHANLRSRIGSNFAGVIKRSLKASHPTLEADIMEFIGFTCREFLPASGPIIKACAIKVSTTHNITTFKGSNGWLERFLPRSPIETSFKLHGKGSAALPQSCDARMEEIRYTLSLYPVKSLYNWMNQGYSTAWVRHARLFSEEDGRACSNHFYP